MQRLARSVSITAPPADVFAFLSDPDNLPKWQPGMLAAERTSPPPTVVGSTGRVIRDLMGERVAVTVTVTELVPDTRLAFSTNASGFAIKVGADIAPDGAGSSLTASVEIRASNPLLAPLEGMLASAATPELETGLTRLQAVFAPVPEAER